MGSQLLTLEVGQGTQEEEAYYSRAFTVVFHVSSPEGYKDQGDRSQCHTWAAAFAYLQPMYYSGVHFRKQKL